MPTDHRHAYTYPQFRLLSLAMPGDGHYRILLERRCRWCNHSTLLTGQGLRTNPQALPTLEALWATPRTQED